MKLRNPTDIGAGVLMMVGSLLAFYLSKDLDQGTLYDMGAGYFPRAVAGLLLLVGALLFASGLHTDGRHPFAFKFRPFVTILGAMTFFTVAVSSLGLALTAAVTVCIASLASPGAQVGKVALVAIAMSTLVCVIFIAGLGLPIALLPGF